MTDRWTQSDLCIYVLTNVMASFVALPFVCFIFKDFLTFLGNVREKFVVSTENAEIEML